MLIIHSFYHTFVLSYIRFIIHPFYHTFVLSYIRFIIHSFYIHLFYHTFVLRLFSILALVGRFLMKNFKVFLSLLRSLLAFLSFRSLLILHSMFSRKTITNLEDATFTRQSILFQSFQMIKTLHKVFSSSLSRRSKHCTKYSLPVFPDHRTIATFCPVIIH